MDFNKDYYAILGVHPSAEKVVIDAAYKALAKRYHPDKNQNDAETAKRQMQEINEAYEILSDENEKKIIQVLWLMKGHFQVAKHLSKVVNMNNFLKGQVQSLQHKKLVDQMLSNKVVLLIRYNPI